MKILDFYRELKALGVSLRDAAILEEVYAKGEYVGLSRLSGDLVFKPAAMTEAYAKLQKRGLVEVDAARCDERRKKMRLTPQGLHIISRLRAFFE